MVSIKPYKVCHIVQASYEMCDRRLEYLVYRTARPLEEGKGKVRILKCLFEIWEQYFIRKNKVV